MHIFQYKRNSPVHISRFEVLKAVLPLILVFWDAVLCRWVYGSNILKGTWASAFIFQDEVLLYADADDDNTPSLRI